MLFSELFQIYVNGEELVNRKLSLIQGTNVNLTCMYNQIDGGRWVVGGTNVYVINSEWRADLKHAYYTTDTISTQSVELGHSGNISCINHSRGYRRTITVDVLCKFYFLFSVLFLIQFYLPFKFISAHKF